LTNGLGFSPDGRRLYHSDTLRHTVQVYDVGPDGSLGPRKTFAVMEGGVPDGLAVDSSGNVWVAVAEGSRVSVFDPGGAEVHRVPVPVPMVTSLCLGGDDYRDLYIVSGSEGQATDRGGGIYRVRAEVPGMARPKARVAIGGQGR
jgi:gluconolactonase